MINISTSENQIQLPHNYRYSCVLQYFDTFFLFIAYLLVLLLVCILGVTVEKLSCGRFYWSFVFSFIVRYVIYFLCETHFLLLSERVWSCVTIQNKCMMLLAVYDWHQEWGYFTYQVHAFIRNPPFLSLIKDRFSINDLPSSARTGKIQQLQSQNAKKKLHPAFNDRYFPLMIFHNQQGGGGGGGGGGVMCLFQLTIHACNWWNWKHIWKYFKECSSKAN